MNQPLLHAIAASGLLLSATAALPANPGLDAWAKVHEVFAHPRCVNCHVGSDRIPIWSGPSYGPKPRPHGMNISGGVSGMGAENGLLCMTCHARRNAELPHGPPGAPVWLLAPVSMEWFGKSSAEICAQVKDPLRNGGKTLEKLAEHVETDALVQWGWAPGPGREPAPYSKDETAKWLRAWARLGAPCPN
jgi:hypothetical protein